MRKIFKVACGIIFYTILMIMALLTIARLFGIKFYNVPTGSMEPEIHAGSLVAVNNKTDYNDIKVGDIIIYERKSDDILIIHRVIESTKEGLYTKGDANSFPDEICITPDIFVGKFIFGIPEAGKIFEWLESPKNKVIYFASMLGLCAIDFILADIKTDKKEEEL